MPRDVELRLLGELELVGPGGPVRVGAAKERRLLAALAVDRDRHVAPDRLCDALWSGPAPPSALNALQNYVLRLRRALRETRELRILTGPGGYRLAAPVGAVDVEVAERLVAEGRSAVAAGDPAVAVPALRAALALWRGPALAEFAELPFARTEAHRLDELREAVREDLVDAELAAGDHRGAGDRLRVMVADAPLRERRWAQLVIALYRDGRQAEALDAFLRVRRVLADELGIDPSPQLVALHERVLRHDPGLLDVRGRGAVTGRGPRAGPADPRRRPLAGRTDELDRLVTRFEAAVRGHGSVCAVVGEPGIGKTSLLLELATVARERGAVVLSGRCLEGDWQPAYHAFAEAVAGHATTLGPGRLRAAVGRFADPLVRLVPQLRDLGVAAPAPSPSLPPDEDRAQLLEGVARFVAALSVGAPVLVVLDDLHWADESTLVMLRHLAGSRPGRVLVVFAYRTDETGPELVDLLGALRAEADTYSLHLRGLEPQAIRELLSGVAAAPVSASLAATICAETSGNPFFAGEVIRHLVEDGAVRPGRDGLLDADIPPSPVPEGVRQVLARRRARLPAPADLLLQHAAAFDGPFPFEVVAAAAGLDQPDALTALDALIAAGLVQPDDAADRYQFAHALIRHAVLADLNPSRRLRLHRRMAEALVAARERVPDIGPGEIAAQYHASAALPGAQAGVGPALLAADRAEATAAHHEAATFLAMALELAPADPRRPEILSRLAMALARSGRFDEAVATARGAAAELAAAHGPRPAADHLAAVSSALASADSATHAWQLAADGLAYAGERRDPVWASLTVHELDRREAADPDFPGMTLDLPQRREALRILLADAGVAGRPDLARLAVPATYGRRDRIPAEVAGDPNVRLFVLGDFAGALPAFEAEAARARGQGLVSLEGYCRTLAARAQIALGRLDDGMAGLAEARRLAGHRRWGWQQIHEIGTLDAYAHATDDGWPDVLAQLQDAYGAGNPAGRRLEASASACGAKAAARLGRADEATRRYLTVLPAIRRSPSWAMNYLRTVCDAIETVWLLGGPGRDGHPDLALLESAVRDKALPADFRFPMMDARLAMARLCAMSDRPGEAGRWFAAARTVLDGQLARPLLAVVDHDEARLALHAGDRERGTALLERAAEAFEQLGMTGWVRRADRLAPTRPQHRWTGTGRPGGPRPAR